MRSRRFVVFAFVLMLLASIGDASPRFVAAQDATPAVSVTPDETELPTETATVTETVTAEPTVTETLAPETPTVTPVLETPSSTATVIPAEVGPAAEPDATLNARNCGQTITGGDFPVYRLCSTTGAGVRFAVMQNGQQVAEIATTSGGTAAISLPNRAPFTLTYLGGNGSDWVPGPGEEARLRYDSAQTFSFQRDPAVAQTWTLMVTVRQAVTWNTGQAIGGACVRILGDDSLEYAAEQCDTDNDGVITFGQLPPRYDADGGSFYDAWMTQAPAGYPLLSYAGGDTRDAANPDNWVANFTYRTNVLRVLTVDDAGNPVPGFCFKIPANQISTDCDRLGPQDPGDGVVVSDGHREGTTLSVKMVAMAPGYSADVTLQSVTIGSGYATELTFVVRPIAAGTGADLRVALNLPNGTSPQWVGGELYGYCFRITPAAGSPSGSVCANQFGEVLIRDLPVGTYSIAQSSNTSTCASIAGSTTFTVTASDLGREKQLTLTVPSCVSTQTCQVVRDAPGRAVDLYYGDLRDRNGNIVSSPFQLSESIPGTVMPLLVGASDRVTAGALSPWVDPTAGATWSTREDWDGNARRLLLNAYAQSGLPYTVSNETQIASLTLISGRSLDIAQVFPGNAAQFPECELWSTAVINVHYQSNVRIYELNATEDTAIPTATSTATATVTATATMTATAPLTPIALTPTVTVANPVPSSTPAAVTALPNTGAGDSSGSSRALFLATAFALLLLFAVGLLRSKR